MLLIFGVSFELPLLLIMLNFVGVLKGERLAKVRRYSIFGIVVFAAFVVPGNDPITMAVLALVLIVLYEVAVLVAKIHDKRKAGARRRGRIRQPLRRRGVADARTARHRTGGAGRGHRPGRGRRTGGRCQPPSPVMSPVPDRAGRAAIPRQRRHLASTCGPAAGPL